MTRLEQKQRDQELVEMYLKNNSTQLTADHFGVTTETIRRVLHLADIPTPRIGRIVPTSACVVKRDLIFQLCEEGHSLAEIARRVKTNGRHIAALLRKNGVTKKFVTWRSGPANNMWKGGRIIDGDGYIQVMCKNHPNKRKHTPYVFEHRLVMEKMIGRFLLPEEVVHHKDGNKQNNAPENLLLFSCNADHLAVDLKGRCPKWTPDGLARIQKAAALRKARRLAQIPTQSEPSGSQST